MQMRRHDNIAAGRRDVVPKAPLGETAITLKGDPDGEAIKRLRKRLSALAGVHETDYVYLTKKLVVKYDTKALSHSQILQEIERIQDGRQGPKRSSR